MKNYFRNFDPSHNSKPSIRDSRRISDKSQQQWRCWDFQVSKPMGKKMFQKIFHEEDPLKSMRRRKLFFEACRTSYPTYPCSTGRRTRRESFHLLVTTFLTFWDYTTTTTTGRSSRPRVTPSISSPPTTTTGKLLDYKLIIYWLI